MIDAEFPAKVLLARGSEIRVAGTSSPISGTPEETEFRTKPVKRATILAAGGEPADRQKYPPARQRFRKTASGPRFYLAPLMSCCSDGDRDERQEMLDRVKPGRARAAPISASRRRLAPSWTIAREIELMNVMLFSLRNTGALRR